MNRNKLAVLACAYEDYQKVRILSNNKAYAYEDEETLKWVNEKAIALEKDISRQILGEIAEHPIYAEYLRKIKGIGHVMSAFLITGLCEDRIAIVWKDRKKSKKRLKSVMHNANMPSQLFHYCGLIPGCRKKSGERIDYNPKMKTLMWKIGMQLLKARGKYYLLYTKYKKQCEKKYTEVEKGSLKLKVHYTALRKMMRVFMCNLWKVYRHQNGLPITEPYVSKIIGQEGSGTKHEMIPVFTEMPEYEELAI